jgi:hypothetical protein
MMNSSDASTFPGTEHRDCELQQPSPNSSPQARISVTVPKGIYKQLKLLAHDREMTVSSLILGLIKAEIH